MVAMVVGVTMVNVVPGEEKSVYNELTGIDGIRDIFHVFGEYDFVVIMEVEGLSTLNKLVDSIREIKGVTSTQTIVGAEL
ncbi:MAG: Lrp/AsnC ligand binding domain-containing protein [Methanocellales archaeon]|nr:Lrp/AsnC ligand binding domain-containing protein [Methanocellales archaeon]